MNRQQAQRQAQMDAVRQRGLQQQVERFDGLIGALSVVTAGIAASIDDGETLNATHVDRLFGLLLDELADNQKRLSQLV